MYTAEQTGQAWTAWLASRDDDYLTGAYAAADEMASDYPAYAADAQVIADGMPWVDADGLDRWPYDEACALAASLEAQDYWTEVVPA